MKPFSYSRANSTNEALKLLQTDGKFIAGGTNLVDLMKEGVEQPSQLVDIQRLPLSTVQANKSGGVSLGALAKNSETANHPLIRSKYPLLTQAILAGASPQIRNMATNGGNLLQRTRCVYFYDVAMPCNKRQPGSGCGAFEGLNKNHAIFGWSETCVATFPSDMCVALAALDAQVKVLGKDGKERMINFVEFHRLPENDAAKDNNLLSGDLIISIELPKTGLPTKSHYLKIRNRASYAFALVSVAVIWEWKGNVIMNARIALGGVAHKPWRAFEAEKFLNGKIATEENFKQAAEIAIQDAKPLSQNAYKITLAKRAIVRALKTANGK
ncbi:MAG: xanthine dehydrogenase family protein subunit M [Pyrinomonadaceae bacterium]|nr:xanthine dehydrogenase family protein subunit M [Pyrinomonadaceae bacterium]